MKIIKGVIIAIAALCTLSEVAVAQNDFRSSSNDLYWKNRQPVAGYWQQDVQYKMNVEIDDSMETVGGTQELTYWNNSPDDLSVIYFHLYQNAFQPDSYLDDLRKAGDLVTIFGVYEKEKKGTIIHDMKCSNGIKSMELQNTILKVTLEKPLKSGESLVFNTSFTTYWDKGDKGNMRRRMKTFYHGQELGQNFKHFDGVHWYPRIAVYDRKFGWTIDQHLGKEFYGDYGQFEVNLTFPAKYVVEATGELVNRSEVLPEDLRKQLDISNYKTKRDIYTAITENLPGKKTWKYKAINVHDFAFTADPTYRIGEVMLDGIRCIALAQEENAHKWQPTAQFVADVVAVYNRDFGRYAYPKIVAADARDGMEYPMLTLNSGTWPGHKYVIAHEVGHNWFFGMVGNNETYRASLDEGFTQFLTAWSLIDINKIKTRPNGISDGVVFNSYIAHASDANNATLNTHSDHFNSAERHGGGYGQVYYKTASMLYNLQYVLGDELFTKAMRNYFSQWEICHPYWADFRQSIIHYTKVDLNWFFDEWLEKTSTIDYELRSVHKKDKSTYKIKIRRNGMQMPLDVLITDKDGGQHKFYIPNTPWVKANAGTVLPTWIGWDMLNPDYEFEAVIPAGIDNVEIDPSGRLADINRLNNSKKGVTDWGLDKFKPLPYDFRKYHVQARPDFWYNSVDGVKAGISVKGGYFYRKHIFYSRVWYNTGLGRSSDYENNNGDPFPVNYTLFYQTRVGKLLDLKVNSRYLDGLQLNDVGLTKDLGSNQVSISARHMMRENNRYVFHPEFWMVDRHDVNLNVGLTHNYRYKHGNGKIQMGLRTSGLYSDFAYSKATITVINNNSIGKMNFRTRTFAGIMTGNAFNPAAYMMLGGANEEQLMMDRFGRSRGIIPSEAMGYTGELGQYHLTGGLNLRGYASYRATNTTNSDTFAVNYGTRGASVNAELDFSRYVFGYKKKIIRVLHPQIYLFGDMGYLSNTKGNSGLRADGGLGGLIRIPYEYPIYFRVDLPVVMNRVPASDQYVAMRYVFGLQRAF